MVSIQDLKAKNAVKNGTDPGTAAPKVEPTQGWPEKNLDDNVKSGPKTYLYSTVHSPSLSLHLGGKTVQAKDGVLKLNQIQHEELQELIALGRPDISSNVRLLDPEAAEKIARDYLERHKPVAGKGMTHSSKNAERNDFTQLPEGADPEYRHATSVDASPEAMRERALRLQKEKMGTLDVKESEFAHPEDDKIPEKLAPNS